MSSAGRAFSDRRDGRSWITLVVLLALTAAVLLIAPALSPQLEGPTATAGINMVLAVGLYTFVGTTGIMSFGHMAYMALGAYAGAILATPVATKELLSAGMPAWASGVHLPTVPAILAGAAVAALFAAVVSFPLMRLRGLVASLATFAILNVVHNVATNWTALTGGVVGFTGAPITTTPRSALVWALVAIVAGFLFRESRVGLRLRASREDEIAALGAGLDVRRDRRVAMVVSGFIVGVGGALTALQLGQFTPDAFYLTTTFLVIVIVVVGGVNSLSGAVIGTLLISAVGYVLQLAQQGDVLGVYSFGGRAGIEDAGLAVLVLAVLLLRPRGLLGSKEIGELRPPRSRGRPRVGTRRSAPQPTQHEPA
ncbi:branched-chain amino acid ABC transporter permease [Conexibacter sp. CPCC 206217]|uniref:branched-chain amino acid ABC transporter permease n=1 Tax=Conexibacter sp. CPCC 206217 TaxID=3064574 RepID=UPI00271E80C8|nr:branched-chain amino acid ABC transporter permease [Conexibacter sp. CPCC 206217]MDO8210097.1 branched-chain amino acid ABC transporter permease [Conexibacter sp. CPCC 206217]